MSNSSVRAPRAPAVGSVMFPFQDPRFLGGDRYPVYRSLRDSAPVSKLGPNGSWLIARYDDAATLFASKETRARPASKPIPDTLLGGPAELFYANSLGRLDPPKHRRLRRLVSQAFTPKGVNQHRHAVAKLASRRAASWARSGAMDMVEELVEGVPKDAMSVLLGISKEDSEHLSILHDEMSGGRLVFAEGLSAEIAAKIHDAAANLYEAVGALVDQKKDHPSNDLITALIDAQDGGDRLARDEMIGLIGEIHKAGTGTISALLGSSFVAYSTHPAERRTVAKDPSKISQGIEEALRWDPPGQATPRFLSEDLELGGEFLREDEQVWVLIGSANRDERVFEDPDTFRVDRVTDRSHFAFGGGTHYCLGASLARMEAEVVLGVVLPRFEHMQLAGEVQRRPDLVVPQHTRIPIEYHLS